LRAALAIARQHGYGVWADEILTISDEIEGWSPWTEMKVRDGVGKYLLKSAVDGLLPHGIVYRKKQGFGAPVAEWFQGELGRRAQDQIKRSSLAERGLLDYDRLDEMWNAHRSGPVNWGFHLWNIYNVSAWHDYWIAGRVLA